MADIYAEVIFPPDFGPCGGVRAADRAALDITNQANAEDLAVWGLNGIVHNKTIIERHTANGVQFANDYADIPDGVAVITSAHGISPKIEAMLDEKDCERFDTTCHLVALTHNAAETARRKGEKVIYVCKGKPGEVERPHDEVAGMVGHLDYTRDDAGMVIEAPVERSYLELYEELSEELLSDAQKYRIVSQTTLNADDTLQLRKVIRDYIKHKQPNAEIAFSRLGDVCRAVANRQAGVRQFLQIIPKPDRIIVVTDQESANGNKLAQLGRQLAEGTGITVHAVENAEDAQQIADKSGVTAITASASTPDEDIAAVAGVFGAVNVPESQDRAFLLHDGKPAVIAQKLADHKQRLTGN